MWGFLPLWLPCFSPMLDPPHVQVQWNTCCFYQASSTWWVGVQACYDFTCPCHVQCGFIPGPWGAVVMESLPHPSSRFLVCLCRNQASQDGCDCRHEAFHYYECDYHWDDSCHFLLTGLCRCKNELGLRLVGLQFDLLSSIVSKPEFFRVGLIDTDKFVGGDQNLTTKVTFLSTYPFPWLVAWSVFSWVSVTT